MRVCLTCGADYIESHILLELPPGGRGEDISALFANLMPSISKLAAGKVGEVHVWEQLQHVIVRLFKINYMSLTLRLATLTPLNV